jgi:hypothetical protein
MSNCPWGRSFPNLSKVKSFNEDELRWLGTVISQGKYTVNQIQEKYQLKGDAKKRWLQRLAYKVRNGLPLRNSSGRPQLLTSKQKLELKSKIKTGIHKTTREEWEKLVNEAINENQKQIKSISKASLGRLEVELGVKSGNGEQTTDARYAAERSKRNLISLIVGFGIFANTVHQALLLNRDATQYRCGCDSNQKVKVVYIERGRNEPLKVAPEDHQNNYGAMSFFIKYDAIFAGNGSVLEPIFIIQDDCMPKDAYEWYKVPGLTMGSDLLQVGYVVMSHSRCPPVEYHRDVSKKIILPYIKRARDVYGLEFDAPALLIQDGEVTQNECFNPCEDQSLLTEFHDNTAHMEKSAASTTAIAQAADQDPFKATKSGLKHTDDKDIEGHYLIKVLEDIFARHRSNYRLKDPKTGKERYFSARHGHMAARGLVRIIVTQQRIMTPQLVTGSFRKVGMVPYDPVQMKKQFRGELTASDEAVFQDTALMNKLKKLFVNFGELPDYILDKHDIFMDDPIRVDGLPIHRRRTVLLTNRNVIRARLLEEDRKIQEAERVAIAKEAKRIETSRRKEEQKRKRSKENEILDFQNRNVINLQFMKRACVKL